MHGIRIANITLVDDFLNKRVIKAQTPGTYLRKKLRMLDS